MSTAAAARPKRLSLPREHGAVATLVAAAALAMAVAPHWATALAALALAAAFALRGPVEQRVGGRRLRRWDGAAIAVELAVAAGAVALVGMHAPVAAAAVAALGVAIVAAGAFTRAHRLQRRALTEVAGMCALGAAAGAAAWAGGAAARPAALAAGAMAIYAAATVLLARAALGRRRGGARRGEGWAGLGALAVGAGGLLAFGAPLAALAFAPRALHGVVDLTRAAPPPSAIRLGVRETIALALFIGVLALTLPR